MIYYWRVEKRGDKTVAHLIQPGFNPQNYTLIELQKTIDNLPSARHTFPDAASYDSYMKMLKDGLSTLQKGMQQ